jgi:hypothetical protein
MSSTSCQKYSLVSDKAKVSHDLPLNIKGMDARRRPDQLRAAESDGHAVAVSVNLDRLAEPQDAAQKRSMKRI